MFKIGCSEKILKVPLFAELYGYGPFQGRRNLGVHDPLFCRVFSFFDGAKRAMIVYTDTCTSDDLLCREVRARIAERCHIAPEGIAFVATHTHSGPALGTNCGAGFGEPHPEFQEIWKQTVLEVAEEAVRGEEEIDCAETGKAPLKNKLGSNRVEVEKNVTDETIRWVKFLRRDGSCKVLLHNHGIHGISMNLPFHKLVSADWAGAVNRRIKSKGIADMPLFLLGPCGDVNTYTSCNVLKNDTAADVIAEQYVADLERDFAKGGEKIHDLAIDFVLKSEFLPVRKQSVEELERGEEFYRKEMKDEYHANLWKEMLVALENGISLLPPVHDFQVIRFGELSFFFIPGEYFVEDGASLMAKAEGKYSFAATVSNGNGSYFPSEKDMKNFPDEESVRTCKNQCSFGYYEIYCNGSAHRYRYADNIASFVAETLLSLEKSL